ncbi:MAG: flagellar motor protein MotB [Bryobacteraceae bacterium]
MPESPAPAPIIIKKFHKHDGHHGGAWKVAYADFVTAMMALFIVLWLMNTKEEIQQAVGGYFRDPTGSGKMAATKMAGAGSGIEVAKDDMEKLKELLEETMKEMPDFQQFKDQVELIITGEGLRIELLETERGMFFESGRAEPTGSGSELLARLAQELGKLPNNLLIEGHTDARPYTSPTGYSNWELSSDRANAARRLMQSAGIRPAQVSQVRGYADQQLRHPEDPDAASNRRVSVIVQYLSKTQEAEKPEAVH